MAEDLPDAPWATSPVSGGEELPDAPWTTGKQKPSLLERATEPITSIPETYQRMIHESVGQMGRGVGQIQTGEPWEIAKGAGNIALGGLGYVSAPISAPIHTIVGKPIEDITGSPTVGTLAEIGAGFALPMPKGIPRREPLPVEPPFGITKSAGETADDLAMRQREQAAIRGADPHAQQWIEQRKEQIQKANEALIQGLDPYAQTIAQTPQEAGSLVSQGVRGAAAAKKAAADAMYQQARTMPGEIHPSVFDNMGQNIKRDLFPSVVFKEQSTPIANQMIDYIDSVVPNLERMTPSPLSKGIVGPELARAPENLVGINLQGVDEIRKTLNQWKRDAFKPIADSDTRATRAVLDEFDKRIDGAINGGMFTGDRASIDAWNNARSAYADYRKTFTPQNRDSVGRKVQQIIGDSINEPLDPTKVMDVFTAKKDTAVASRLKTILGDSSPEWVAAKQGVTHGLLQTGEGEAALSTGQVAQRISKYLNSDMAKIIYTPEEQKMLRSYGNLMRQITMPPGSYFPSAPGIAHVMSIISNRIGAVLGGMVGRIGGHLAGVPVVGELAGITAGSQAEKLFAANTYKNISRQLPLVGNQMRRWNRYQAEAQATGNPLARRAAAGAAINLQNALRPLGIDIRDLTPQSMVPAYGDQNQQ